MNPDRPGLDMEDAFGPDCRDMVPIPLDAEPELNPVDDETQPLCHLEDCESSLEKLAYWQAVLKRDERIAQMRSDKIALWLERRRAKVQRKIDWHQTMIESYMRLTSTKKLDLPSGKVTTVKGRQRLEITDQQALDEWLEQMGDMNLCQTVIKPLKKGILAYIKDTGEEPPGIELVTGNDKLNFKPHELGEAYDYEEDDPLEEDDGQPTEQQEMEDFAQDDDFHNMSAADIL